MKKIGLTGNIAAGKSSVEKIITKLGYKVIDADNICHDLLENNIEIKNKIKNAFANFDILDINNEISRKKLGEVVFTHSSMKKILENILHPEIINEINKFCFENQNEKLIFISVPLLFEAKMENIFDKIILICANENIRLKRLIARNNYTIEYAKKRIDAQEKEESKKNKSDFIIKNNDDLEELKSQTIKLINLLETIF